MLNRIVIDNFATIEHLSFDLEEGLNIITGETGAGKSVLVEAISTALGGRADISMVRNGTNKATIQIAGTLGDEDVIIVRELMASGKSISKLNGEMVTLGQLRTFCQSFVDIHGQYDNQVILDPQNHLSITDRFRHKALEPELAKLSNLYQEYAESRRAYQQLQKEEAESLRQQDYYRFESEYIEKLNLYEGEDEELHEELEIMKNSEKIFSAVNEAYRRIYEDDESVLSGLQSAIQHLQDIASLSEDYENQVQTLNDSYYAIADVSDALRDLRSSMNYSDEDIDRTSERLSIIEDAKRKYRMSVPEIIAYGNEMAEKLRVIENFDVEMESRKKAMDAAYKKLQEQADIVSRMRQENAALLKAAVTRELQDLAFANSDFDIEIQRLPEIGPLGYDTMEYMISTNPGEPLRPLSRIASGGEISRIMLAFKHIIGDNDAVETMIFDEIDTGISGRTALVVGKKMREIAGHHQILCITHLPQIAAYGDANFQIQKDISDSKTHTNIVRLDEEGKLHMLAGMISGDADSASALEAARELNDAAKMVKH
jgi:DNA repair protein RecN (Recombination protein N)